MAKDAKGHGSEKREANSIDSVYSSKAGVGGLGQGMYARTASGAQYKLNAAATGGRIPSVGSDLDPSQHTAVTDQAAADTLAGGHPKSGVVPVHGGASGREDGAGGYRHDLDKSRSPNAGVGPFHDSKGRPLFKKGSIL